MRYVNETGKRYISKLRGNRRRRIKPSKSESQMERESRHLVAATTRLLVDALSD